jgi:hypothetical protein
MRVGERVCMCAPSQCVVWIMSVVWVGNRHQWKEVKRGFDGVVAKNGLDVSERREISCALVRMKEAQ